METLIDGIRADPSRKALIVIDVQNDFLPGGPMAVPDGDAVIPAVHALLEDASLWDGGVFASQDWHPADHVSFYDNNEGAVPFTPREIEGIGEQMMWTRHCVQGSKGAELAEALKLPKDTVVVLKGKHPRVDSYSAFGDGKDKTLEKTELEELLQKRGVEHLYVCGLATDYCVAFTAKDAVKSGLKASVILPASRGIAQDTIDSALEEMKGMGIALLA
ncbi:nicotinamidase [Hyaloraphidium curvatum]|nr:nicotinamidase [Hyaloraphidium curvatum]